MTSQSVQAGSEDWQQEKYLACRRRLIVMARKWKSPYPEDAVDEVFSRALKNDKVREALHLAMGMSAPPQTQISGWLHAWLVNCLYNVVREQWKASKGLASLEDVGGDTYQVRAEQEDSLQALVRRESADVVRRCMRCLKGKQSQAWQLFVEGKSYQEIAIHMRSNPSAVAWYIAEARKRVAACVRAHFRKGPENPHV